MHREGSRCKKKMKLIFVVSPYVNKSSFGFSIMSRFRGYLFSVQLPVYPNWQATPVLPVRPAQGPTHHPTHPAQDPAHTLRTLRTAFSAFCHSLRRDYDVPSRRSLQRIVHDLHTELSTNVENYLRTLGFVHLQVDGWEDHQKVEVIGVTAKPLDPDLKPVLILFRRLGGRASTPRGAPQRSMRSLSNRAFLCF
jgi:hypothetical protein